MEDKCDSKELHLKLMRKLCFTRKERKVETNKSTNDLRREKRLNIVNSFRGLDCEWFYFDFEDDLNLNISNVSISHSIEQLVGYIINSVNIDEHYLNNCIEEVKQQLKYNRHIGKELIKIEFFQSLSTINQNQIVSRDIKVSILELIELLMPCMKMKDQFLEELLIKSGIMLSIMMNFNAYDIKLVTKSVNVMQMFVNLSNDTQNTALDNGYILFLRKIIELNPIPKRKTKRNKRTTDSNICLIGAISESLLSLTLKSDSKDILKSIYPLLEKLILFKDHKIISDVMMAFSLKTEFIVYFDFEMIETITELMNRGEDDIVLRSVQIWTNFITHDKQYLNLVTQTKMLANIRTLLESPSRHSVMKEIATFLLTLSEINTTFATNVLIESQNISPLIKALPAVDYFSKQQLLSTITKIIASIQTSDLLNYLLESGLIEVLPQLLELEETNLTITSLEIYFSLLSIAQKFGQQFLVSVVYRGYWSYIYEWCHYFQKHQNKDIVFRVMAIKTNFPSPQDLNIG